MAPQRSTSMDRMWHDWRETFPDTETEQDGWIGDLAHASGVSGHNPDDTSGVTAERQDTDSKQEVRAIDKDKRLNHPTVTLEMVIQRMLRTPADLARLIYIIYNRRIWKKSNGWKQEAYTGSDPHDKHAHLSGDPASDENGAEWKSITSFGANMSLEPSDPSYTDLIFTVSDISLLNEVISGGPDVGKPNKLAIKLNAIHNQASSNGSGISEIKTAVANIGVTLTPGQFDELKTVIEESIDTTLTRLFAEKMGELIESTYGSEAFKNGVKAGVAAQLDDNPNT